MELKKNMTMQDWKVLVREMAKQKPDAAIVKSLMTRAGLEYSKDPILQMSTVLQALEKNGPQKSRIS
ncbi:MAG: hypothetical protein LW875_02555 [Proteobacteria bacterium]|nr:hypothetical protein [Pseudomonadota bacterium]